jgi:SOS-response transcriptional repressor LexA
MSQVEISKELDTAQRHYSRVESGTIRPSGAFLEKLVAFFGVTPNYLLLGEDMHDRDDRDEDIRTEALLTAKPEIRGTLERVWFDLENGRVEPERLEAWLDEEETRRRQARAAARQEQFLDEARAKFVDELAERRRRISPIEGVRIFGDAPEEGARPDDLRLYRIAAGRGVEPLEVYGSIDNPDPSSFSPKKYFALRVEGESMSGDDLHDGDLILVRRKDVAEPHEIAVVENTVRQLATLKRVRVAGPLLELFPSNPDEQPFSWESRYSRIKGVFVQKLRSGH